MTTKIYLLTFTILLCFSCKCKSQENKPLNWDKVKVAFKQWRSGELKKGYYVENCLADPMEFIEKYGDKWMTDSLRYALPAIPKKLNEDFDTCLVDINFDGKQDVIFRIRPEDCLQGNGSSVHPPIHITFISKNDNYVFDNSCIDSVEKTIKDYAEQLSSRNYQWFQIKSISTNKNRIIISGSSFVLLDDDASCCPSIEFDFKGYVQKSGKGYIEIDGIHRNWVTEENKKIKLQLLMK
jgi:hypothetical protein